MLKIPEYDHEKVLEVFKILNDFAKELLKGFHLWKCVRFPVAMNVTRNDTITITFNASLIQREPSHEESGLENVSGHNTYGRINAKWAKRWQNLLTQDQLIIVDTNTLQVFLPSSIRRQKRQNLWRKSQWSSLRRVSSRFQFWLPGGASVALCLNCSSIERWRTCHQCRCPEGGKAV